jgi:hypothetical protein
MHDSPRLPFLGGLPLKSSRAQERACVGGVVRIGPWRQLNIVRAFVCFRLYNNAIFDHIRDLTDY